MANISRRIPGPDVPSLQVSIHIEKLVLMNKIIVDTRIERARAQEMQVGRVHTRSQFPATKMLL
jgi:hypothetical protein